MSLEQRENLARGAIGLREVLFQSVSVMAPAGAVAYSLILGARYAGKALALSVVLALLPCLSVAIALGQMARHLPSAGALFTFPARALHPWLGFLVAWAYIYVCAGACGAAALLIGLQLRGMLTSGTGASANLVMILGTALPPTVAYLLNVRGIRSSARTGTLLGVIETAVICAIATVLIVQHRERVSVAPLTLAGADAPGFVGLPGVVAGAAYAMLAFGGFEGAAPLAEEARNPRATVPRAMILSCLIGAGIYALTSYAAAVALGGEGMARFGLSDSGSAWVPLARSAFVPFGTLLELALLSCLFGALNGQFNALTRTWFSMGRSGVLPATLARLHPRYRSPHIAAAVQLVACLGFGAVGALVGATDLVILNGTVITALILGVYMIASLSAAVFFWRERRAELRPWLHLGVPLLGALLLVPSLCTAIGLTSSLMPFVVPLEGAALLAGPVLLIWMLLGVGVLAFLAWKRPEQLARGGEVLTGGVGSEAAPS